MSEPAKKASLSPVSFDARILGARTLVKGGTVLNLVLSDKDIKQISRMLECKKLGYTLEVLATPVKPEKPEEKKNGRKRRTQRYPYRAE